MMTKRLREFRMGLNSYFSNLATKPLSEARRYIHSTVQGQMAELFFGSFINANPGFPDTII